MATSDGAALLAATVRAAILDQAPRRTVQAVAVGVFGALLAATTAAPGSSAPQGGRGLASQVFCGMDRHPASTQEEASGLLLCWQAGVSDSPRGLARDSTEDGAGASPHRA
jgi:hypothetical protein